MSQILDALRRAEAQRSRGRVPGLHQTASPLPLAASGQPSLVQRRPVMIALALVFTMLAIAALWFLLGRATQSGSTPAKLPPASEQPLSRPDAAQAPVAEKSVGTVGSQTAPLAITALPRKAQLPERRIGTKDVTNKPLADQSQTTNAAGPAATSPAAATVSELSKPPAVAAAALPTRQELAADIQRSLPPITVSGSVYSSDSTQRMLVVNGEIWREGDQIAPGLVLEQIRRRDAILRYSGIRFTVGP